MNNTEATQAEEVAPNAGALIESMRAFGYSLPTAVADLVDNSITAGATRIEIEGTWAGEGSVLRIRDDGAGMSAAVLVEAMRLGSRNPAAEREADDLGRFGLGLKSASWSQARVLTVTTRTETTGPACRRWDLDRVSNSGRWLLESPEPAAEDLPQGHGTTVTLSQLDRLVGLDPAATGKAEDRFLDGLAKVETHLGMVFHRFLAGRNKITIIVNGNAITPWDPFLENHPATQALPGERINWAGHPVEVAPYVLPHVSKLNTTEHARASGPAGWNAQQGFYVYRGGRLLVAGGWLGLPRMQREEHHKLARIRVDLDNTMDAEWQIDVRKATARVPGPLREDLQRIAKATRGAAGEAYRFRGKTIARTATSRAGMNFVWLQRQQRDGSTVFRVNRDHPSLVGTLAIGPDTRRALDLALRLAEENLPVEAIVMETRQRADESRPAPFADSEGELETLMRVTLDGMTSGGLDAPTALAMLANVEPFDSHPAVLQTLREEIQ